MEVKSEQDFKELRKQFSAWRRRFPMFIHDVNKIEDVVEKHIQNYSKALVLHRQTHSATYLEQAQHSINEINRVVKLIEKIELMSMLAR